MQKQIKAHCRKQVLVATTLTSSLFGVSSSTSPQHLPALHHPAPNSFTPGLSSECTTTILAPKVKNRTLNMQLTFPYVLPQIIFLHQRDARQNQQPVAREAHGSRLRRRSSCHPDAPTAAAPAQPHPRSHGTKTCHVASTAQRCKGKVET